MSISPNNESGTSNKRRDLIKSLASLPVLGALGVGYWQHTRYTKKTEATYDIVKELGLSSEPAFKDYSAPGTGSTDTIRLGIIGAGSRSNALLHHLGFATENDAKQWSDDKKNNWLAYGDLNVVLTAVCEVFDSRAENTMAKALFSVKDAQGEQRKHKPKRYTYYQDLLEDDQVDAVIIATPDHWHAPMTIAAIQAGKHVYCEKGPSHSEAETFELERVVRASDKVYQLGHQIRHNPIYPYAADLVKQGVLGEVNLVEVTTNRNSAHGAWVRHLKNGKPKAGDLNSIDWKQWLGDSPEVPFSIDRYYNWTKYWDYSTGLLGQLFSHEFDAANGVLHCGIPESVVCSGGIYYYQDGREIPDLMQVVLEYPHRKMTMIYSATLANSKNRGRVIMGRDASMEIGKGLSITPDGSSEKYKQLLADKKIAKNEPMLSVGLGKKSSTDANSGATASYYEERGLTSVNVGGVSRDVTHLHLREWINAIRYGSPVSCGIDRAFEEAVTIQMAKKAYLEKRQVRWDAKTKTIV
ncbi:Gfo/Idh/MocA family protein [Sediminicola luteus]|uniref:Oxidoreductase n=1 Tax=Sediminicola luteus TaxID=319238 RepID=A0A2A4G8N1_9FLAO|nr:Gfo/Idh/MocA family oxidoreductase [Sediminicola luteus]PCE64771.1 hypothetical protein B7P33_06260 [Sediminicola luteus]